MIGEIMRASMRLDVGGGRNPEPGFVSLDIEDMPGVDIVAPAWKTGLADRSVIEIRARHFLEHLTLRDARRTVREWWRILDDFSFSTVTVPNIVYHAKQLMMDGNSQFLDGKSNFEHALAGFYGWQSMGETMGHKYGYTHETLTSLFTKAGFSVEVLESRECDIVVIVRKR